MSRFTGSEWARLLVAVSAVALVVVLVAATAVGTIKPVIDRDFPDPSVVAAGDAYYAYSTAAGYGHEFWHVPVQRSSSLTDDWSPVGDAMPNLPPWVARDGNGNGNVTAPEVIRRDGGDYLLYFVALAQATNVQCIGSALASAPTGPFAPAPNPLICQSGGVDSIDPQAFTDGDGKRYLLYSSGQSVATIWLQQVAADRTTPIGPRRALIAADRPEEANIAEAPAMVKRGNEYVLFYSGNTYNSGHYFVNYATAHSVAGPFVKHDGQFLSRTSLADAYTNPGGQSVVPGPRGDYLVFHASVGPHDRAMFAAGLKWDAAGEPVLEVNNVAGTPLDYSQ